MSKEKRDEVIKLLQKGHNIGETVEKTGTSRGYVSKINRSISSKSVAISEKPFKLNQLSEESLQILYNLQGVYGKKSLDETVRQLGEDFRSIFPVKYEFDHEHTATISDVFNEVIKEYKILKKRDNNIFSAKNNDWIQRIMLKVWDIDSAVFALHDIALANNWVKGTIIESMSKAFIYSFKERNWDIECYFNDDINEQMPIIISPKGIRYKFPIGYE